MTSEITHSGAIHLIGPDQHLKLVYPPTTLNIDAMLEDLRILHERS